MVIVIFVNWITQNLKTISFGSTNRSYKLMNECVQMKLMYKYLIVVSDNLSAIDIYRYS